MALADVELLVKDNPALLKEVQETYGLAEATGKIKKANEDLTKDRDTLTTSEKTLKSEKTDLEKQLKAAKEASGKDSAPEIRALEEKITTLTKEIADEKKGRTDAETSRRATELKNSIITAATSGDLQAVNADDLYTLMTTKGLVGSKDGKDFHYKLNEKNEQVAVTPAEAVQAFLTSNPTYAKASGTQGTGAKPDSAVDTKTGLLENPEALL